MEFVTGLGMVWLVNAVHLGVSWAVISLPGTHPAAGWLALWFPLLQLLYVVPVAVIARKSSSARMWGTVLAGVVTLVASTALWFSVLGAVGRGLR
jgi:hypothetical protein